MLAMPFVMVALGLLAALIVPRMIRLGEARRGQACAHAGGTWDAEQQACIGPSH